MSQPCCMKAPSENQRELKIPKSLLCSGVSFSFCWFWDWEYPKKDKLQLNHDTKNSQNPVWSVTRMKINQCWWLTWSEFRGRSGQSSPRGRGGQGFIFVVRVLSLPFVRTETTYLGHREVSTWAHREGIQLYWCWNCSYIRSSRAESEAKYTGAERIYNLCNNIYIFYNLYNNNSDTCPAFQIPLK